MNGSVGFVQGSACSLTHRTGAIKFAVRRCTAGTVELKIYNDSTKTTLFETITIADYLP